MAITADTVEVTILTGLRAFLLSVLPSGTEVIRTQVNRVAEPVGDSFVMMTPSGRKRLSTNTKDYDHGANPVAIAITEATQVMVQLDFHGPTGSDNQQVVMMLWRDGYAVDFLDSYGIAPLYADDGHQMPFINGENQYEDRWVTTVLLQANPTISTPQQFADSIAPILVEIDADYPPSP